MFLPDGRCLHAVVRGHAGLVAVVSETAEDGTLRVVEVPLAGSSLEALPRLRALHDAFARLAHVRVLDDGVAADVALVLAETIAPAFDETRAVLRRAPPPRPLRASAAHPRAFRGTKAKPPKAAAAEAQDLRRVLCHARGVGEVTDVLGLASAPRERPWWFHRLFAEALMHLDVAAERAIFGAATQLSLAGDEALAVLCARVVARAPALGAGWLEVFVALPAARRHDAASVTCAQDGEPFAADRLGPLLPWLASPAWEAFPALFASVLGPSVRDTDPALVALELELRATCAPRSTTILARAPKLDPRWRPIIEQHVPHVRSYARLELLDALVHVRGLTSLFEGIGWRRLDAARSSALARAFMWLRHRDVPEHAEASVRACSAARDALVEVLSQLPDARVACFTDELDNVLIALEAMGTVEQELTHALGVIARAGRTHERLSWGPLLAAIARLPRSLRAEALAAPDASFVALLAAARRRNGARLVGFGLHALAEHASDLFVCAFERWPKALMRTAKWLGTMRYERRVSLVRACLDAPLFIEAAAHMQDAALVRCLDEALGTDAGIVPRALRAALSGERVLTDAQRARHLARMRDMLDLARLRHLERRACAEQLIAIGAGPEERTYRVVAAHATSAEENRRALRRMLRALVHGDRDYVLEHPRTQAWRRTQTGIDVEAWLACALTRRVQSARGELVLALERDPLEALHLGTYVDTCLGLGGGLTYSAAAVALDANKLVLYARTRNGEVVARQLVAIAEDGRLVAYAVYGAADEVLRRAFAELVHALAAETNTTLVTHDDEYFVPNILSRGFWDDGIEGLSPSK